MTKPLHPLRRSYLKRGRILDSPVLSRCLARIHPSMKLYDFGNGVTHMPEPEPNGNGWKTSYVVTLFIDDPKQTRSYKVEIQRWDTARAVHAEILKAAKEFARL